MKNRTGRDVVTTIGGRGGPARRIAVAVAALAMVMGLSAVVAPAAAADRAAPLFECEIEHYSDGIRAWCPTSAPGTEFRAKVLCGWSGGQYWVYGGWAKQGIVNNIKQWSAAYCGPGTSYLGYYVETRT